MAFISIDIVDLVSSTSVAFSAIFEPSILVLYAHSPRLIDPSVKQIASPALLTSILVSDFLFQS